MFSVKCPECKSSNVSIKPDVGEKRNFTMEFESDEKSYKCNNCGIEFAKRGIGKIRIIK